jgi:hypothetical protein
LNNARFANGQNYGADFRLSAGGVDLIVSRVAMRRVYNPGGAVLQTNNRTKLVNHRLVTNPFAEGYNPVASQGGMECRSIPSNTKFMYFHVADILARAGNPNVTLSITFWDAGGADAITLQYNSVAGGNFKSGPNITKVNTPATPNWRTVNIVLTDASFTNASNYSADFRLGTTGPTQYIRMVKVSVASPMNF